MRDEPAGPLATAIVVGTGAFWGIYWLPVRALAEMGLPGAWGTAAIILLPAVIFRRKEFIRKNRVALASVVLGGAAFALYSVGFLYGRVAIIILLYFFTPVWSTLIGRYAMGWHRPLCLPANILSRSRSWGALVLCAGVLEVWPTRAFGSTRGN